MQQISNIASFDLPIHQGTLVNRHKTSVNPVLISISNSLMPSFARQRWATESGVKKMFTSPKSVSQCSGNRPFGSAEIFFAQLQLLATISNNGKSMESDL